LHAEYVIKQIIYLCISFATYNLLVFNYNRMPEQWRRVSHTE